MTILNSINTCVVLCFDDHYVDYSIVTLTSILDNYHFEEPLDVVCLVPPSLLGKELDFLGRLPRHKNRLKISFRYPREAAELEKTRDFTKLLPDGFSTVPIYRLFMPSVCHEFDRAIYIDSDVLAVSNLSQFLVMEMYQPVHALHEQTQVEFPRKIGLGNSPYFNDGVLVANLALWRSSGAYGQILRLTKIHDSSETRCFEMDILNIVFEGKWYPLGLRYSYFNGYEALEERFRIPNPILVHFAADAKPWVEESINSKWKKLWLEYYSQLQVDNI